MPQVTVTARGAARVRAGHPWVFAADVSRGDGTGDVVRVVDGRGALLGTALYAPGASLALRMLARDEVALDEALLAERLRAALARRRALFPDADALRVVHGESDRLPGLFVDRYGDVAVVQTTARGMDAREPAIARLVAEVLGARLVVARDDGGARDFEGLPRRRGVLLGRGSTVVRYHDAGNELETDVLEGGKTGAFLDQAENHARARGYAPSGDALDAFTHHGGFALALARGGARSVLALDEDAAAIARTRANAEHNRLGALRAETTNAFDALRRLEGEGRRFDAVVIDPPALAKRRSALAGAERAYKELNLRALRLLNAGGLLITCSCSGKLTPERFGAVVEAAVQDVGRPVQILERQGAGRDHPPLVGVPETDYLKCWFLRVLE
jgi:23S rRNA (cytosine1962-C5)-methyltransferase